MSKVHKTAKGTELPILILKGKDYLEVKYRIVWFREDHPEWGIETEIVTRAQDSATVKAVIRDEKGRIIAVSHKTEDVKGFPDFVEKAETGSIGRALALIGYGTQFCADELDEGKRIVDSPVAPKASTPPQAKAQRGGYVVSVGKYKNQNILDIDLYDLNNYVAWIRKTSKENGKAIQGAMLEFVTKADALLASRETPPAFKDEPWPT